MFFLFVSLILSILSCSLTTGFILTYAIIVMPGLSKLNDKDFLSAFKITDSIIQNNQPIFILIWIGSIFSVLSAALISILTLGLSDAWLILLNGLVYIIGVQGITAVVHLPLNNRIQKLNLDELNFEALHKERLNFEKKWNLFNIIRTIIAFFVTTTFVIVLVVL